MKHKTFKQFKREALRKPKTREAYNELGVEFSLIEAIISQRLRKGLTQKKLAERVGMKQSAIARFESGNTNPTLAFIQKISNALGMKIKIHA